MRRILVWATASSLALGACAAQPLVGFRAGAGGRATLSNSGFVTERYQRDRANDYLKFATQQFNPGYINNVIANAERARRDSSFHYDSAAVTPGALAGLFTKIDTFQDTSDFTMLELTTLLLGYGKDLRADTREAISKRFVAFKYWYTEPQPAAYVDDRYYWSENHRIIYHSIEFLAGQTFPKSTFTNDGHNGAYHRDLARKRILTWIDEKLRFGFSEWHSDVYYQEDIDPLIALVEFANDPVIRERASMMVDLFLTDMALHLRQNNFGATHGRSYMKDKSKAADQDTFDVTKELFNNTPNPYVSYGSTAGVFFARAKNYRLPKVILDIANSKATTVDREHMGVAFNPEAPVTANPVAPEGYPFTSQDAVPFWFERGAQTAWQEVESTITNLDRYNLWTSQFYAPFKPLRDVVGNDFNLARTLTQQLSPQLSFAALTAVDTYTYRSSDVMLSTAQDYRKGMLGEQHHISQATLDDNAIVFTTSPKNDPLPTVRWPDDDGYFTGNGALPRAAQHGTVSMSLYAPQYVPNGVLPARLGYIDKTHAYFPQERFDEVVQHGNWTFGRKGNGYVALYSWRATHWQSWDPATYFNNGLQQPYDLVADGGSDNVWITEVGDKKQSGSFNDFVRRVSAAPVNVSVLPANNGHPGGFDVQYSSPSQGQMGFGWAAPLTVGGQSIDLVGTQRFDNPFVAAPVGANKYRIHSGSDELILDFTRNNRSTR